MTSSEQDDQAWKKQAAYSLAREAGSYAFSAASDIKDLVKEYIQRGPEGVGWLCFVGGMMTIVFGLFGSMDVVTAVTSPLAYFINIYQIMFGIATCFIEAPEDWVRKSQRLQQTQAFFHEFARFLTTFGGRGLFYLFQGTLAMSMTTVSLSYVLALYMFVLGALCIAMQYGFEPNFSFLRPGVDNAHCNARSGDYIHIT
mmetsp:Transcript_21234/g.59328  ORF Transcript_21234/g.59328 Transcript_21234/m.59328 type:complete len:199 (-) Transcript_21234:183-779(-)|eukprot:CAMPEP_0117557274 /NCGR_PEP_ID=MMETSP0784-20121206/52243_1 /TAXON_ID=39447 /ORGANISM="" /LENGTH=198 /DNA_ID=CAMNT_0005354581 /DNA_START=107 /DNA_END=703 /DNA_ORIENTATION=-